MTADYAKGDYVEHPTGLYRTLVENPGSAPTGVTTADWLLIRRNPQAFASSQKLTQAEYDALVVANGLIADRLYMIVG